MSRPPHHLLIRGPRRIRRSRSRRCGGPIALIRDGPGSTHGSHPTFCNRPLQGVALIRRAVYRSSVNGAGSQACPWSHTFFVLAGSRLHRSGRGCGDCSCPIPHSVTPTPEEVSTSLARSSFRDSPRHHRNSARTLAQLRRDSAKKHGNELMAVMRRSGEPRQPSTTRTPLHGPRGIQGDADRHRPEISPGWGFQLVRQETKELIVSLPIVVRPLSRQGSSRRT